VIVHVNYEQVVIRAYKEILGREPDPIGLKGWIDALTNGLSESGFYAKLAHSDEGALVSFRRFSERHGHDPERASRKLLYQLSPILALHHARLELIRHHLPPGNVILDLGGAHPTDPRGTLLAFGYPHKPRKLYIVDLPPDIRFGGGVQVVGSHVQGVTTVTQVYGRMTELNFAEDSEVDLVISGQSIEHVTTEEAHAVFHEVARVLKPGGFFCLDTPNRRLTEIQAGPGRMLHPEHKKEYLPHEFLEEFSGHPFRPLAVKGVCHMPRTVATGRFDLTEWEENLGVNEYPDESYVFFICYERL